ncbi:MAG TPA: hypothetical protein VFG59_09480 [Anaeromyxobacter sp.]|nr:hypothetical protein [Anaeromyxobacter sp.]
MEKPAATAPPLHIAVPPGGGGGIPQAGGPSRPTQVLRSRTPIFVAFGVALLAAVLWVSNWRSTPATLRRLPAKERAALMERTLSTVREICREPARPREFCREQASILLDLPECDRACQALAKEELLADSAVK